MSLLLVDIPNFLAATAHPVLTVILGTLASQPNICGREV
jgi:hypothetical protein